MGREKLVKVEGLTKKFDGKVVLEDINFTVMEGEAFGILGKSGSGKTVLMNAMRGVKEYEPTAGVVLYNVAICPNVETCGWVEPPSKVGTPCKRCGATLELEEIDFWAIRGTPKFRNLYNRLSMMLQRTFALYTEKTVIGNVEEALKDIDYPRERMPLKIMELVKRVKLVHRSLHPARDLSGGEKQRVVLARQLARDPIVLFADEPTGTLDPITAQAVHEVLRQEVDGGLTLVMTSHWLYALVEITDRGIVLEDGHITMEGKTTEIKDAMAGGLEEFEKPPISENIRIRVENCKKYFYTADRGAIKAVDGVSFEVREGEILGIVGVSGAGKTTLGRIIAGLQVPSLGKAYVKIGDEWIDMSVPGATGRGRATPYIAILHQEYGLYPHSTILENLTDSIGLILPKEIAKAKATMVLEAVGFDEKRIEEIFNAYPDELGEGERHRIALARALMKEPEILILDEPTGTIDSITQNVIAKAILSSRAELGQTYIIMSHDPDFIEKVCDRAILMRGGKIVEIGDPRNIVKMFKEIEKPMDV
ncbi:methyl coenzyme M reductase system, component A2 [Candidatus Alkanophaga liquidiphilum]